MENNWWNYRNKLPGNARFEKNFNQFIDLVFVDFKTFLSGGKILFKWYRALVSASRSTYVLFLLKFLYYLFYFIKQGDLF